MVTSERKRKPSWLEPLTERALKAHKRRYGSHYDGDLDDTHWWKWLVGWEAGYKAGLRAARRNAR